MTGNFAAMLPFVFIAIIVAMRLVWEKMIRAADVKRQLRYIGMLFVAYTVLLLFLICGTYREMSESGTSMAEYHSMVVFFVAVMGFVMLFTGILCYIRIGKRRLSDEEKMRLRDM